MKLLIVSLCKNEAATIGELIDRIPRTYPGVKELEIHVIDDGSTDKTAAEAAAHKATVHSDGVNKGLAFRFRDALDLALERDADIMVHIDGDLQFRPEDIPALVTPIVDGMADFVAADRFTDAKTGKLRRPANMPTGKYWGNKFGARVLSKLARRTFSDVTSGFRSYNRAAILALNLHSNHTYTQESFQILAIKRLRILSLPLPVTYHKNRRSRVVSSVPKYLFTSALNIMRAYRDFAPLRFFFGLGGVPLVIGSLACLFSAYHWATTGSFSPYKFVGIGGLYFVSIGIFLCSLGLVADMLVRLQGTQDRSYEDIKRLRSKTD